MMNKISALGMAGAFLGTVIILFFFFGFSGSPGKPRPSNILTGGSGKKTPSLAVPLMTVSRAGAVMTSSMAVRATTPSPTVPDEM